MSVPENILARARAEGRFTLLDVGAKQGRLGLVDYTVEGGEPEMMCCLLVIEPNGNQYMLPLAKMLTGGSDEDLSKLADDE